MRNKKGQTESDFLSTYDAARYERPSVTVDTLLFTVADTANDNYRRLPEKELRLLLIRRADHPYLGKWGLPGGFIHMDESLEDAARRELQEETGLNNPYLEQLYTWGDVDRDPRTRVISCAFMALVDSSNLQPHFGSDAADAQWFTVTLRQEQDEYLLVFKSDAIVSGNSHNNEDSRQPTGITPLSRRQSVDENVELQARLRLHTTPAGPLQRESWEILSSPDLAFDHARIIAYGIQRLRAKLDWTDAAFALMPETFTLTELQQVYEVILDTPLFKANFRRKLGDRVMETTEYRQDLGHRPSRLYRYNPHHE